MTTTALDAQALADGYRVTERTTAEVHAMLPTDGTALVLHVSHGGENHIEQFTRHQCVRRGPEFVLLDAEFGDEVVTPDHRRVLRLLADTNGLRH